MKVCVKKFEFLFFDTCVMLVRRNRDRGFLSNGDYSGRMIYFSSWHRIAV